MAFTETGYAARKSFSASKYRAKLLKPGKDGYISINMNTGRIIERKNSEARRHPASLTKLMTLYMIFEAIDKGKINLNTIMKTSAKAASMQQTNISLKKGDYLTVKQAIDALIVRSANDAAVVVAEHLGKTEAKFARLMTAKAHKLGMKKTIFKNASGLHNPAQTTTARDMATLALALHRHHPRFKSYYTKKTFYFKGRKFSSHNNVMKAFEGSTGMKTGYINASGYNLVSTAKRKKHEILTVVLGGRSAKSRDKMTIGLLNEAFKKVKRGKYTTRSKVKVIPLTKKGFYLSQHNPKTLPPGIVRAMNEEPGKTYIVNERDNFAQNVNSKEAKIEQLSFKNIPINKPAYQDKQKVNYTLHLGFYVESREAMIAAANATSISPSSLNDKDIKIDSVAYDGMQVYGSRITHLDKVSANIACNKIRQQGETCSVMQDKI